jgi:S1-C subfamily serine protease
MDDQMSTPEIPSGGRSPDWALWMPPTLEVPSSSIRDAEEVHDDRHGKGRSKVLAVVAGIGAAALIGGVAGHALWPAQGSTNPEAQGLNLVPSQGDGFSPRFGGMADGDGSSGATSTSGVAKVSAVVSPALVNINTDLGYQGSAAAGTGIVLTSDGTVLTNNHVIRGATRISATDVGNGQTYDATVVGYDRSHDIAVIKLTGAKGLKTVSIGNSNTATVGQSVVGIGNAGGRGGMPTVASGAITALGRSITASDQSTGDSEDLTGLIATDADIQPGQSGGPLADMDGKVIGVDTAASASYAFSEGTSRGYAIPINQAMSIVRQISAGHASATIHIGQTGFLGVQVQDATTSIDGNTRASGVSVIGAIDGSPAQAAGLGGGSSILAVDGVTVTSPKGLTGQLGRLHPGDSVSVVWTDASGATHTSKITLAKGPAA